MKTTAVDEVTNAYKVFNKTIDRILAHPPGPARWRACVNVWLTLHPQNAAIYKNLVAENATLRTELNKHGLSQDKMKDPEKNLRSALAFPHGLLYLIDKSDPQAFRLKKNASLMHKALSEFTTREVY